jgi:hypothetical protein
MPFFDICSGTLTWSLTAHTHCPHGVCHLVVECSKNESFVHESDCGNYFIRSHWLCLHILHFLYLHLYCGKITFIVLSLSAQPVLCWKRSRSVHCSFSFSSYNLIILHSIAQAFHDIFNKF